MRQLTPLPNCPNHHSRQQTSPAPQPGTPSSVAFSARSNAPGGTRHKRGVKHTTRKRPPDTSEPELPAFKNDSDSVEILGFFLPTPSIRCPRSLALSANLALFPIGYHRRGFSRFRSSSRTTFLGISLPTNHFRIRKRSPSNRYASLIVILPTKMLHRLTGEKLRPTSVAL
jgi:hypothetical protein